MMMMNGADVDDDHDVDDEWSSYKIQYHISTHR